MAAAALQVAAGAVAWVCVAGASLSGGRAGAIAFAGAALSATAILLFARIRGRRAAAAALLAAELIEASVDRASAGHGAGGAIGRPHDGEIDERPPAPRIEAPAEVAVVVASARDAIETIRTRLVELEHLVREQQSIFASMGAGLLAIDPEQRILSVNRSAASMLGVDPDRVRGKLVQQAARHAGLNRFVGEASAAEGPTDGEFVVERSGQARITVQAASEPLRDAAGERSGLLISLSDVTQLRRLETLRSDFAANVSHELRTPITNIKGYVETMLQVGVDDRDQAMRFLEIVRRNAQQLGAIIEDLLALARLEQPGSREALEPIETELRAIVDRATEDLTPAAQAKGIVLRIEVPASLRACVTPSLVQQAIANLVSNAITYSPPQSTVQIRGEERPDGMVGVAVVDRGPGIAAHHLPRIFERFYRIDRARSREHGGTGLGLAIVKHIAQVQGGRVEVESRLGAGSTFRLVLPTVEAAMAQVAG
ncbi:MAG TPA: ATP-binding protein [Phycisphaerales bacterium]|nr:ATP-binding protein [Phycisphaerales bacterium]